MAEEVININNLCDDVLLKILNLFSLEEQLQLKLVCRYWQALVNRLMKIRKSLTISYGIESEDCFCSCHRSDGFLKLKSNSGFSNQLPSKFPNLKSLQLMIEDLTDEEATSTLNQYPLLTCVGVSANYLGNWSSIGQNLRHLKLKSKRQPVYIPPVNSLEELSIDGKIQIKSLVNLSTMKLKKFQFKSDHEFFGISLMTYYDLIEQIYATERCPLKLILSALNSSTHSLIDLGLDFSRLNMSYVPVYLSSDLIDIFGKQFLQLRRLNLQFLKCRDGQVVKSSSLKKLQFLEELTIDLQKNFPPSSGEQQLLVLVKLVYKNLRKLTIKNGYFTSVEAFEAISNNLESLQSLQLIDVCFNLRQSKTEIFWGLIGSMKLKELIINRVAIDDFGIDQIKYSCSLIKILIDGRDSNKSHKISTQKVVDACKELALRQKLKRIFLCLDEAESLEQDKIGIPKNMLILST